MDELEYGPVEMFVAGYTGDGPDPQIVEAILELVNAGTVRLLDLLFVSRAADGNLTVDELEAVGDRYGFGSIELAASGIAGDEDIEAIAEAIEPGVSGALLVIEHVWAKRLANALYQAGGSVLFSDRIPAPAVNAVMAEAAAEAPAESTTEQPVE
ncbi:DUF6325 family protein [Arthrobacter sp. I2-34]|uniref:DUF6325 family protein n=1 Tax=Arthrobacter hankyongi TaxID=2904801 RepID=A0ABS9L2T4_9MICC|nr:DUF6325 family protein [Arthrobacter hankyongi]MCG2620985.1 DUF6325 family protein [Arthrobacter hankyongi]